MFDFVFLPECTIPDYESMTDLVRYAVNCEGCVWYESSLESARDAIRQAMSEGLMAFVSIECAYWTKRAYALSADLHITYAYGLVWKRMN